MEEPGALWVWGQPSVDKRPLLILDLDGTLIKTRSGKKWPTSAQDWECLVTDLTFLSSYNAVIFTNQAGLSGQRAELLQELLQAVYQKFALPLLAAGTYNAYRKPNTFALDRFFSAQEGSVLMVGDAAGREGDFSDSDRKLAFNWQLRRPDLKIQFFTPEEFFQNATPAPRHWRGFNPQTYRESGNLVEVASFLEQYPRWTLFLVGPPRCGKSTAAQLLQSSLGGQIIGPARRKKMLQSLAQSSAERLFLDGHFPDLASRADFLGFRPAFYLLFSNWELAQHLNIFKERQDFAASEASARVPEMAYRLFAKRWEKPPENTLEWQVPKIEHLWFRQKS